MWLSQYKGLSFPIDHTAHTLVTTFQVKNMQIGDPHINHYPSFSTDIIKQYHCDQTHQILQNFLKPILFLASFLNETTQFPGQQAVFHKKNPFTGKSNNSKNYHTPHHSPPQKSKQIQRISEENFIPKEPTPKPLLKNHTAKY